MATAEPDVAAPAERSRDLRRAPEALGTGDGPVLERVGASWARPR